jgi:Tol biopolymer transport system component
MARGLRPFTFPGALLLSSVLLMGGPIGSATGGSAPGNVSTTHSLLAFSRCGPDGCAAGTDIWVIREDGSGLARVTRTARHNDFPSWSPDGKRIAFARSNGVSIEIWTMSAQGRDLRRLTTGGALDQQPAWSPDGDEIAFVREHSAGQGEIYLVDAAGQLVQLTHRIGDYRRPTWSPDGRRLAFAYARDPKKDRYGIYVVNADGRGEHEVSRDPVHDYWDPAWSPDGRRLAFSYVIPHAKTFVGNLDVMSADGRNQQTVLQAPPGMVYFSPSWSSDDSRIAFVALDSRTGLGQLRFVNSDGSGLHILRQIVSDNRAPAWQHWLRGR